MKRAMVVLLLGILIAGGIGIVGSFNPVFPVQAQSRPTLYWGSTGENVRIVQWKLQEWGYYKGRIDGVFGANTAQAVRSFQAKNGLPVDGLVGPRTWAALGYGGAGGNVASAQTAARPTLYWGTSGQNVRVVQQKLKDWGYYAGSIDGVYGAKTYSAVQSFQRKNGLSADGKVGPRTWAALGLGGGTAAPAAPTPARTQRAVSARGVTNNDDIDLLARLVAAEAEGEPYKGQVAVGAVIMNRVKSSKFPNSLSGVAFQPHAFESVSNGLIWQRTPSNEAYRAARDSFNGYDPTYGCLFFWNPSKPISSKWIWTRQVQVKIGKHVFGI